MHGKGTGSGARGGSSSGEAARAGKLTTYGQVAQAINSHPRVVPKVLEIVRALCLQKGWPALTAIVLRADQRRPGDAFLDPWVSRDTPQATKDAMVDQFIREVHAVDWTPLLERYPLREKKGAGSTTVAATQAVGVTLRVWAMDGVIYLAWPEGEGFTLVDRQPGSPYCHVDLYDRLKTVLAVVGQWGR